MSYDPRNWYYAVADTVGAYSSGRFVTVPSEDPEYVDWTELGNSATPLADEATLKQVLANAGVPYGLAGYAAAKRWEVECAGIIVAGIAIATDDRSKMMIMGARIKAAEDPNFTTRWKTETGFIEIDAATIVAMSDAVLAHVDACFAAESAAIAAIEAGTITTAAEVDALPWPS